MKPDEYTEIDATTTEAVKNAFEELCKNRIGRGGDASAEVILDVPLNYVKIDVTVYADSAEKRGQDIFENAYRRAKGKL